MYFILSENLQFYSYIKFEQKALLDRQGHFDLMANEVINYLLGNII